MKTGEIRDILVAEIKTLVKGESGIDRAKQVVNICNGISESLKVELAIKKFAKEMKSSGETLQVGDIETGAK